MLASLLGNSSELHLSLVKLILTLSDGLPIAGSMHTLADGQRIPCAGVNVSDANFSLPYSPVTAFPALNEGSACPDTPLNVHMLFACSRLVYEDARVMKDVVLNR